MADISITPASFAPVSGSTQFLDGIAGATITAGQTCYYDTSTSTYKLADANGASPLYTVAGIACHGASSGQPLRMAVGGNVTIGATIAAGAVYVQSATAGGIAPVADLTTGHYTTIIGVGVSTTILKVSLFTAGVAV